MKIYGWKRILWRIVICCKHKEKSLGEERKKEEEIAELERLSKLPENIAKTIICRIDNDFLIKFLAAIQRLTVSINMSSSEKEFEESFSYIWKKELPDKAAQIVTKYLKEKITDMNIPKILSDDLQFFVSCDREDVYENNDDPDDFGFSPKKLLYSYYEIKIAIKINFNYKT